MEFLAHAILVVGCIIGGLAMVAGFFQTLFGNPWAGLRAMIDGAIVVFCALVVWAIVSPAPADAAVPGRPGRAVHAVVSEGGEP